jgi:hypothetical protein
MARRITTHVVVQPKPGSSDAGFLHLYPGDEVPDWAVHQLGDHAMTDDDADKDGKTPAKETKSSAKREKPSATATPSGEGNGDDDGDQQDAAGDGPPPKAGQGSSKAAWEKYATDRGVHVDEDATRDSIIAALDAAGVPTGAPSE